MGIDCCRAENATQMPSYKHLYVLTGSVYKIVHSDLPFEA